MRNWCLFLMCAVSGIAVASGPGFSDVGYTDALAQAKKEQKLVFIDFFATWCGPCKMLDRTTFVDPKVVAWMKEKTVAIKIDGEAFRDLSTQYKITAFPTMILAKADGSEMRRVVGYRDANQFLEEFQNPVSEENRLSGAQASVKADPMNFELRVKEARVLADGDVSKGLAAYKQILADIQSGAMKGESSLILMFIRRLPGDEAKNFLLETAATSKGKILAGDYSSDQIGTYAVLSAKQNGVLSLYDGLISMGKTPEALVNFRPFLIGPLRANRRYAELEKLSPATDRLADLRQTIKDYSAKPDGEQAAEMLHNEFSYFYGEFVAQNRLEEADRLATEVLGKSPSAEAYNQLAWAAFEAGSKREVDFSYAKKAYELSKGEDSSILDTYAQLLAVHGRKDEARKLVTEALAKVTKQGRERKILEECLESLNQADPKNPQG